MTKISLLFCQLTYGWVSKWIIKLTLTTCTYLKQQTKPFNHFWICNYMCKLSLSEAGCANHPQAISTAQASTGSTSSHSPQKNCFSIKWTLRKPSCETLECYHQPNVHRQHSLIYNKNSILNYKTSVVLHYSCGGRNNK